MQFSTDRCRRADRHPRGLRPRPACAPPQPAGLDPRHLRFRATSTMRLARLEQVTALQPFDDPPAPRPAAKFRRQRQKGVDPALLIIERETAACYALFAAPANGRRRAAPARRQRRYDPPPARSTPSSPPHPSSPPPDREANCPPGVPRPEPDAHTARAPPSARRAAEPAHEHTHPLLSAGAAPVWAGGWLEKTLDRRPLR